MQRIGSSWLKNISIGLFVFFVLYWILFQIFLTGQSHHHHQIYTFSTLYGIMALWGTFCGLIIASKWGGFKSFFGRALIFLSIGLFLQEFGQLTYSYFYIVKQLQVADYPSLGDLGFFGTIPFYCIGVIYIAKVSGVGIYIKSLKRIIPSVLLTFSVLAAGYYLFLQEYTLDLSAPVKTFLDFGYPFGSAIYISLAISTYILSHGALGGLMKNKIRFLIFALFVQFLADYTFLYQTSRSTWVDSGVNDLIYLIAYFCMTLALVNFNMIYMQLKEN
jgi:hypothetical protein